MIQKPPGTAGLLARLWRDERGVSAIEYGLIASLIAFMSVQALTDVGEVMAASFARSANEVSGDETLPNEPAPAGDEPAPDDFGAGDASGADAPTDPGGGGGGGRGGGGGGGGGARHQEGVDLGFGQPAAQCFEALGDVFGTG